MIDKPLWKIKWMRWYEVSLQSALDRLFNKRRQGHVSGLITLVILGSVCTAFPERLQADNVYLPLKTLLGWKNQSVADFIKAASPGNGVSAGKATLAALRPFTALVASGSPGKTILNGPLNQLLNMGTVTVANFLNSQNLPEGSSIRLAALQSGKSSWEQGLDLPAGLEKPHHPEKSDSQKETLARNSKARIQKPEKKSDKPAESSPVIIRVASEDSKQEPLVRVAGIGPNKPFHPADPTGSAPVLPGSDQEEFFTDYLARTQEDYAIPSGGDQVSQPDAAKLIVKNTGDGNVSLNKKFLHLLPGQTVHLRFEGFGTESFPDVASLDAGLLRVGTGPDGWPDHLKAANTQGKTELYLIYRHSIAAIIQAKIGASAVSGTSGAKEIANPLKGISLAQQGNSLVRGPRPDAIKPFIPLLRNGTEANGEEFSSHSFALAQKNIHFQKVIFKVIDDRSDSASGAVIPVQGIKIEVPGTPFSAVTDGKGETLHTFIPASARFIVRTGTAGFYAPGVRVIGPDDYSYHSGDTQVITVRVTLKTRLDYQMALALPSGGGENPHEAPFHNPASLCATVRDQNGAPLSGVQVVLSAPGTYATYLNQNTGLPGPEPFTSESGRFCIFNSEPGSVGIKFLNRAGEVIDTFPASLFSGYHQDTEFKLYNRRKIKTRLAVIPPPQDHASDYMEVLGRYRMVDMANIIPLGGEHGPLAQLDYGLVGSVDELPVHQGRICYVSEASEFDMSYQCMNEQDALTGVHVTPLIPFTFLEALSSGIFKDTDSKLQDPGLGAIIVEHGDLAGQEETSDAGVRIEVVNMMGIPLRSGFIKNEPLLTESVFFNVHSGVYNVLIWNEDDVLIASDTVTVFEGATSYTRTGNSIIYQSKSISGNTATPATNTPTNNSANKPS